jgi:hypothetical protein
VRHRFERQGGGWRLLVVPGDGADDEPDRARAELERMADDIGREV